MNIKFLESIKSYNYSNDEILQLINSSYNYFSKHSLTAFDGIKEDENKQRIFSNLVRFFRSINTNKKIEEGMLLKEISKNYSNTVVESLNEKVNEIITIQTNRTNFSDKISRFSYINNVRSQSLHVLTALKSYRSMSYRINVIVSNKDSNRVLTPEIILTFLFNDGDSKTFHIDIKIFQELRRVLAYHIKKIIDNEGINFLRN